MEAAVNKHIDEAQKLKFRLWLQRQFSERCQRNSRYSLRSFARLLELEASTVSQLLSGKRAPSRTSMLRLCERLSASSRDLKILGVHSSTTVDQDEFYQLQTDTFAVLADWYHFAILELTFTTQFTSEPKWIAKELDLPVQEVKAAVERLTRLGLLEVKKGRLQKTHLGVTNHSGLQTSIARKSLQKQIIGHALKAVDEVAQDEKDITSMTMAIDPKNLDRARELSKKFRREMCALLEDGKQTRVYNLAVQLYPVSKGSSS